MDFLLREDLLALVPILEATHVIQGFGLLQEVPALYGLIWNTAKFIDSLVELMKSNETFGQIEGKPITSYSSRQIEARHQREIHHPAGKVYIFNKKNNRSIQ